MQYVYRPSLSMDRQVCFLKRWCVAFRNVSCCGARHHRRRRSAVLCCRPLPLAQVAPPATGGAPIAPPLEIRLHFCPSVRRAKIKVSPGPFPLHHARYEVQIWRELFSFGKCDPLEIRLHFCPSVRRAKIKVRLGQALGGNSPPDWCI